MLDENGNMDEALLVKYLLGEAEEEERALVESWLEDSAENRKQYNDLQKVWKHTAGDSFSFNADTDLAWSKLSARIDEYEKVEARVPVVRTLQRPKLGWAAAAVVLALVGLFGIFRYYLNPTEVKVASGKEVVEEQLPDGSAIALNANSKIQYPRDFNRDIRKVELIGEAFFEVEPDAQKPFVIDAGIGEIMVLGTSFNVEAYHGKDLKVHVVSGRVQLSRAGTAADSASLILTAGEAGIIDQKTGYLYRENPLYEDALFWLNKKLVFKKTPLPKVFEILEKNYKVRFSTYDPIVNKCLLTARFEDETIESILAVISATFDIQFEMNNEMVQITTDENNCAEG